MKETRRDCSKPIYSFPPLVDERTKILVLGTMPGDESLAQQMYYAQKNNHFWDFMHRILDPEYPFDRIAGRKESQRESYQLLLSNRIGLWDILESCIRNGSSDSKITNVTYNKLAERLPKSVEVILCGGDKVYKYLKKSTQLTELNVTVETIGSTSTQNPTNTFVLYNQWREAFKRYLL